MDWPKITSGTPMEEVVRIHRAIWDYVIEHKEKPDTPYLNDCAFCEYASCEYTKHNPLGVSYMQKCRYCLGDWPKSKPWISEYFCERGGGLYSKWLKACQMRNLNRAKKLAIQIRNIPIKNDVLKGE